MSDKPIEWDLQEMEIVGLVDAAGVAPVVFSVPSSAEMGRRGVTEAQANAFWEALPAAIREVADRVEKLVFETSDVRAALERGPRGQA